ncbi:MAG: hypothetical protein R3E67_07745 [Pseudomonadales bacterium]
MSALSKRSTVYFDPSIHQALRLKAASTQSFTLELVDEAVRLLMRRSRRHQCIFGKRIQRTEISYEVLLNDLKKASYNVQKICGKRFSQYSKKKDVARILTRIDAGYQP